MKHLIYCFLAFQSILLMGADWHHPLYLDGGKPFAKRFRITVENRGEHPLSGEILRILLKDLPLSDENIRVVNQEGQELLFRFLPENGEKYIELAIPVTAKAGENAEIWIYCDNSAAWPVPDMLTVENTGFTDSFESGNDRIPPGWEENMTDSLHRNFRSESVARTGGKSLETRLEPGAKPSWVKFFRRIPVRSGTKYRISAWLKGENIAGGSGAGFYLHLGPRSDTSQNTFNKLGNYGSFNWKKIEFEGVVPEDAEMMVFGTALHAGSGRAWFDDVEVSLVAPELLAYRLSPPEKLTLHSLGKMPEWELDTSSWPDRYTFKVCNMSKEGERKKLCSLPVNRLTRSNFSAAAFRLFSGGRPVPFLLMGGEMIFEVDPLPPASERIFTLYLAANRRNPEAKVKLSQASAILSDFEASSHPDIDHKAYERLVLSEANLLKNPSFEKEDTWSGGGEKGGRKIQVTQIVPGGLFGKMKAQLHIPADAPPDWYGFRQAVPARQGRTYLIAGFVESDTGTTKVWIHEFTRGAPGSFTNEIVEASGGRGWKPFASLLPARHADSMIEVHLTSPIPCRQAYDGIIVAEIASASDINFESFSDQQSQEPIRVWQVNPIIKIFPESVPLKSAAPLSIALARNEAEGLQLAVRSLHEFPSIAVHAGAARNEDGVELPLPETGVIGLVRLDAPSRYYHFTEVPGYRRCIPSGSRGELYPDPILPGSLFSLKPCKTQGLYLRIHAPQNVPSGIYRGEITFHSGEEVLKVLPYEVKVWDFTLPLRPKSSAILDNRFGSGRQFKDYTEMEAAAFLAKSCLSFDEIPQKPVFALENGIVKADFTEFDKTAQIWFGEWDIPLAYLPLFREHFGWGLPPKPFLGVEPYEGVYPYQGADRGKFTPEYRRVCQNALKLMMSHLREKGWADRFLLYIADEPHTDEPGIKEQLIALCDMLHEAEPGVRIYASTWGLIPELIGKLDVWGIGVQGQISVTELKKLQKSGAEILITTDGIMCLDTPFNAQERMLPLFAWCYETLGYEYWGADWFTRNPYEWGTHIVKGQTNSPTQSVRVRYPNGDGYFLYPGYGGVKGPVSSIRLESLRDGVEDYSYYVLLEALVRKHGDREGTELLEKAKALAAIPNAGGRKSELLLPDPDVLTELRDRIGERISILNCKE